MAARLFHSDGKKENAVRIHAHCPPKWLRVIDRAARHLGLSRANFMATAAYGEAQATLEKAKAEKAGT